MMQLETMFPGPDGAEFIKHLTDGSFAQIRLHFESLVIRFMAMLGSEVKEKEFPTRRPERLLSNTSTL